MKRIFTLLGLSSALVLSPVSADELKNSLTNMLNTQDSSGMVDLSNINLNGKAKPIVPKSRSSKSVIAIVNGKKILKKEADDYLKLRTKGKVTDFDRLPPEQRKRLIEELSLPMLILQAAKKELSKEEKQAIYVRAWMQKEALTIKISDDEVIEAYNKIKKQSEEQNATREVPPFDAIKERLKMQLVEKTLIDNVMKNAKITVE